MHNSITWITGEAQLDWLEKILYLRQSIWPEYQRLSSEDVFKLYLNYSEFQWLAYDNEEIVGIINSLPVQFNHSFNELPEGGLDWVLSTLQSSETVTNANYLAAISATINPIYQKLGLSKHLLLQLKVCAKEAQYKALIVPARPSKKECYPLIPIEDYLQWRREDNTAFDPWLRTHEKLGAKIVHPCNQSRFIKATIKQWEHWLKFPLPQTGHYLIQGGLNPLFINKEEEFGVYIEPNVWVIYPIL